MRFKKTYFQYSLIIILILDLINSIFTFSSGSFFKLIVNIGIYVSLFFVPIRYLKFLKIHVSKKIFILLCIVLGLGILNILLDLSKNEVVSLFGNTFYGPSFIVPIFFLLAANINVLYWLNKLSLISIKIGVLIMPFLYIFHLKLQLLLFFPTFFILLNYKYVTKKNKIWILLSLISAVFFCMIDENSSRTAVIRIIFSLIIFIVVQVDFRWLYKIVASILLFIPLYFVTIGYTYGISIFEEASSLSKKNNKELSQDTRTFLYAESYADLIKTNSLILGKGPVGTYKSDYFRHVKGGDNYIRHNVEVGVLHYLLKGGLIYLISILLILILAITNALNKECNRYIISLGLLVASFFLVSFIENIPQYSFYFASVWTIVGICSSNKFKKLNEHQIKFLIQNEVLNQKKYRFLINLRNAD